jgi:hypothetical protein
MQIRLSGLRGRNDDSGRSLSGPLASIPRRALRPFARRLRDVAIHVLPNGGDAAEPAGARVEVRRHHGPSLVAYARGADPLSAARRAIARVRRLLRRDIARHRARRPRLAAA